MHRIADAVQELDAVFDAETDANPTYMTTSEKKTTILGLKRAQARLLELLLRVEADAGDLAAEECSGDVSGVLVAAGVDDARHAKWEVRFATEVARHEHLRAAMAAGEVTEAHAKVIVQTLTDLPDEVGAAMLANAEAQLCGWAAKHTPAELRVLGKRILTTVDPEHGEEIEARWIRSLEEEAEKKITVGVKSLGDGTRWVSARLTDPVAARFLTVLEAYAQPRKAALDADGRVKPRGRLLAEALESLLEHIDPDSLPAHGGDATTVIVTTTLESLRSDLGLATMADGTLISGAEARRLACTASIIPCVLGGDSEVLDLGRSRRLFSPPQRKALGIRDKHCRAEGCTVPATWCDSHHLKPWSQGGKTNLDDGVLLCGHHHRSIHNPKYEYTRLPNGDIRFHRRR